MPFRLSVNPVVLTPFTCTVVAVRPASPAVIVIAIASPTLSVPVAGVKETDVTDGLAVSMPGDWVASGAVAKGSLSLPAASLSTTLTGIWSSWPRFVSDVSTV